MKKNFLIIGLIILALAVGAILLYKNNYQKAGTPPTTAPAEETEGEKLEPILQHNLDEALEAVEVLEELGLE